MTQQEHCTTLFVLALYYYWIEQDKLNAESALNTAIDVSKYPWYK